MMKAVPLEPTVLSGQTCLPRWHRRVFGVVLATALGACAPMEWHKAGATEDALRKDLDECREYARVASWQDASLHGMNTPRVVVDPAGRAFVTQNNVGESDRFLVESDLTRACMQRQGYELKPVESGKPK